MEKYYKIKKEIAERAGYNSTLRAEVDGYLLLSEKDMKNISFTTEEKVEMLGGIEATCEDAKKAVYPEKIEKIDCGETEGTESETGTDSGTSAESETETGTETENIETTQKTEE